MGVNVAIVQAAADTGGGTQDFTVSGFGTPKAYMTFMGTGLTNGTAADVTTMAIGAGDGTRQWASCVWAEHNNVRPLVWRRNTTDESIMHIIGNTPDAEADFTSFITDGVRLTWGVTPAAAYLITVVLFGGTDLTAYADATVFTNGLNETQSFTDAGFEPDVVYFGGTTRVFDDNPSQTFSFTVGFAANTSPITQGNIAQTNQHNAADSIPYTQVTNNRVQTAILPNTGNLSRELGLTAFEASGFELTKTGNDNFDLDFGYLALNFNAAVGFDVDLVTSPTSTGNFSATTLDHTPQFVMMIPSYCDTINTILGTGATGAGAVPLAFFTATDEFCIGFSDEDDVGTTNTQSLTNNQVLDVDRDTGANVFAGTFVSMNSNGWTLNVTTTDGTARQWPFLSIGTSGPPTNSVTVSDTATGLASPKILAGLGVVETALGIDSQSQTATMAVADTATGIEVGVPGASVPVGDLGDMNDFIAQLLASVTESDTASGADVLDISAATLVDDTGNSADSPDIQAALTVNDTGTGADNTIVGVLSTILDSFSGNELAIIAASVTQADTGVGTDVPLITVQLTVSDTGTGTDIPFVLLLFTVADTFTGVEATLISASVTQTDSITGSEQTPILVSLSVSDIGTGVDTVSVQVGFILISVLDALAGLDTVAISAQVPVDDTSAFSEAVPIQVSLSLADAGTFTDTVFGGILINVLDALSGIDAVVNISASLAPADSAAFFDAFTITVDTTVGDTGSGDDDPAIGQSRTVLDTGIAQDSVTLRVTAPVGDLAALTDAVSQITASVRALDSTVFVESIVVQKLGAQAILAITFSARKASITFDRIGGF